MANLKFIPSALLAGCLAATSPMYAPSLYAQTGVPAQTVVHRGWPKNGDQTPAVSQSQLQASIDGKRAQISNWAPLTGDRSGLQMVSAHRQLRASIGHVAIQ